MNVHQLGLKDEAHAFIKRSREALETVKVNSPSLPRRAMKSLVRLVIFITFIALMEYLCPVQSHTIIVPGEASRRSSSDCKESYDMSHFENLDYNWGLGSFSGLNGFAPFGGFFR